MKPLKILIGGVPYGCDNVGDEAILAVIARSISAVFPEAQLTVSTRTMASTTQKLGVRTVPLFGFDKRPSHRWKQLREFWKTDLFLWGGATGLSDYPHVTLRLVRLAKWLGKRVVLYSVGMNDELNPSFHKLQTGRKFRLLRIMEQVTFHRLDWVRAYEQHLDNRTRHQIRKTLNYVDLIITRDERSADNLRSCGVTLPIKTTADPALLLSPIPPETLDELWNRFSIWKDDRPICVFGISSQREVRQLDVIAKLADELVDRFNAHILLVPMNPYTDASTMQRIIQLMTHSTETIILKGLLEPEEVAAILSRTNLVISSRLHLLILASIHAIPIVGLSRGSKIDTFLQQFGESSCGTVENFSYDTVMSACDRLMTQQNEYRQRAEPIVKHMQSLVRQNPFLLTPLIRKPS